MPNWLCLHPLYHFPTSNEQRVWSHPLCFPLPFLPWRYIMTCLLKISQYGELHRKEAMWGGYGGHAGELPCSGVEVVCQRR